VKVGALGPAAQAAVMFGLAADAGIYRAGAGALRTAHSFTVDSTLTASGPAVFTGAINVNGAAAWVTFTGAPAATDVIFAKVAADAEWRWRIDNRGEMEWGSGAVFADTNLYRGGAALLKTDSSFVAVVNSYARYGNASQVAIGTMGPANEAGILFGAAGDTGMYRAGSNALRTDDTLIVQGGVLAENGQISHFSYVAVGEIADPVPQVDKAIIYGRNNAGKMELVVQFGSGAPQVIKTEL
jgi:hypothetical protein